MIGLRYLPDVTTLQLDREACSGCGICLTVCPHNVFRVEQKKARIADRDACMECGACAMNCADDALTVESGVGCAAGIIYGAIRGTEPTCDCGTDTTSCC